MKTYRTGLLYFAHNGMYGLIIFIGAFLLFQVEPLISKYILPWFGGGPAVWTAAMAFFQVVLLAGYAYAYYLSRLRLSSQGKLHLMVLALVLAYLVFMSLHWKTPITPGSDWKPAAGVFPVWRVLAILAVSVGLPYLLLSTTSSLIQSWFSRTRSQASPYSFYVLSNAASLIALLSYPVLVEPNWTVIQQARFWSAGFVVYLLLVGFCAVRFLRSGKSSREAADQPAQPSPEMDSADNMSGVPRPGRKRYLVWISLAACASVMLLATTNQICQDVASIPFLWVLPLSLYLFSFVIAFNDHQQRFRSVYVLLTLAAIFLGLIDLAYGSRMSIWFQIGSNAFLLFVICLLCHSELYLRRPHPRYLTSFYLMLSIGGAAGGLFVNLVAPLIFKDFWEYNLGLLSCAVIISVIAYQSRPTWLYRLRIPVTVAALTLAVFILLLPIMWMTKSVAITRNFYGVVKIRQMQVGDIHGYDMLHGAIVHGSQASGETERKLPTRYYTQSSGIGLAINNHPNRLAGKSLRVGVIGLGVGTLASYGRPGDAFRFFEIDPDVIRFAEDTRYFTYLKDSPAAVDVVEGDGRLSLERELSETSDGYDILVIDAFSGDSIPTHLVSTEAIRTYLALLNDNGVLAFNITNRHINLEPVLALAAANMHLNGALIHTPGKDFLAADASWVLMTRSKAFLDVPPIAAVKRDLVMTPSIRLWTDDYSNLFQILW